MQQIVNLTKSARWVSQKKTHLPIHNSYNPPNKTGKKEQQICC